MQVSTALHTHYQKKVPEKKNSLTSKMCIVNIQPTNCGNVLHHNYWKKFQVTALKQHLPTAGVCEPNATR